MNYKSLAMLSMLLLLSGCTSMMGNTRSKSTDVDTFHNISDAVKNTSPVLDVKKGDFKNINIDAEASPKIEREGRIEYFEVVELNGVANSNFSITVASLCDCLGFRKWAVLAETFIFAPDGTPIEFKKDGTPETQILTGKFPKDGKYKILVIADTKYLDQTMGTIHGYLDYTNSASGITLPLTVHPTGLIQVAWDK